MKVSIINFSVPIDAQPPLYVIAYRQRLADTLRCLRQQYPEQMTISIASLAPEQVTVLQELIQN